ncbi:MAG: NUDIX domain-containing protein [Clostridia bacterium]|nr:NUDIX domain-containing protein [Oscillospiraceae bacterium]MBR2410514.1 NUDIX domain-containing protein [Clostridia bacterium]
MLGKIVRVKVTKPCNYYELRTGVRYIINYGIAEIRNEKKSFVLGAYILGVNHPVRVFEGKIIAILRYKDSKRSVLVVAPKNMRRIDYEIRDVLEFNEPSDSYTLDCLYEHSCGAVVYRRINGEYRFLLIKNRRSNHWGFPKGHMEKGETREQTAKREVLEETGIHINIIEGFCKDSQYKIGSRIEKRVEVFLGSTEDTQTVIQKEEIEDYRWLRYPEALETLKFENDKEILISVKEFMTENAL